MNEIMVKSLTAELERVAALAEAAASVSACTVSTPPKAASYVSTMANRGCVALTRPTP